MLKSLTEFFNVEQTLIATDMYTGFLESSMLDMTNGEFLLEVVAYWSPTLKIAVNSSQTETNFKYSPYIKVYVGNNPNNCEKLARINLKEMKYEEHYKDSNRVKNWKLTNGEKRELNELMDKRIKGRNITVWESIKIAISVEAKISIEEVEAMFPDGHPDFTQLK